MKKAVCVVVLYTAVMAGGMALIRSSRGIGYSDPGFLEHFVWVLLGLATATVLYVLAFRTESSLRFTGDRRWRMYAIAMTPIIVFFVIAVALTYTPSWAFWVAIIGTLLVGIGEEIAFRRVLFGALLKREACRGRTVGGAVLVSSLAFSALHAVNVLGGQSVAQVGIQLVLTFFAGIMFAGLYLETKSLPALIAFHWLWDALTFMGVEKKIPAAALVMLLLVIVQLVIGLILFRRHRHVPAQSVLNGEFESLHQGTDGPYRSS